MRSAFASLFLAQLLLSTTCMTLVTPVRAQEPMMSASVSEENTDACHHEQKKNSEQTPDSNCLNHCLSQATNRTIMDRGDSDHAAPALPVVFSLDFLAMAASSVPNTGADFHPSPPPLTTVVMLQ